MSEGNIKRSPIHEMYRFLESSKNPLMEWLDSEALRRGDDRQHLAEVLKVTEGYLNQLRRGIRAASTINPEFGRACASYLGVSPVVVLLVAGALQFSDFEAAANAEVIRG